VVQAGFVNPPAGDLVGGVVGGGMSSLTSDGACVGSMEGRDFTIVQTDEAVRCKAGVVVGSGDSAKEIERKRSGARAGGIHTVAWEADGKGFFVSTFLPESFNLLHVTARGKAQVLESNPQTLYMNRLRASPDGKYLAFEGEMADSNVWLLKDF